MSGSLPSVAESGTQRKASESITHAASSRGTLRGLGIGVEQKGVWRDEVLAPLLEDALAHLNREREIAPNSPPTPIDF